MKNADLQEISKLSSKHAPPRTDLRQARIKDDWGSTNGASVELKHKKPDDVTIEHFEAYCDVFGYIHPTDLLFYLYPVIRETIDDPEFVGSIDFLAALNTKFERLNGKLSPEDQSTLLKGIRFIKDADFKANGSDEFFWDEYETLRKSLGMKSES